MRLPFLALDVAVSPTAKATAFGSHDQGLVIDWPFAQIFEGEPQRKDDPPAPTAT